MIVEIAECFIKKKKGHDIEDLKFIHVVSDLVDFRLWDTDLESATTETMLKVEKDNVCYIKKSITIYITSKTPL